MLNARPVRRGAIPPKAFRPAPQALRSREGSAVGGMRRRVLLAGLALLLLVGIGSSARRTDTATAALTAVQRDAAILQAGVRAVWRRHLRQAAVADALENLEEDHRALRLEVLGLRSSEAERLRLAHLLQMSERHGLTGVAGRVVARGGGGRDAIRIDVGTEKGIAPGQAVVSEHGVVGQIVAAGSGWADVLCVTDPSHGLSGVLPNGHHGTLRGTRDALAMDHVLSRNDPEVGGPVLTSGQGGVFPPGIPIGVVRSTEQDPGTPFLAIEVEPLAPPGLLSEVLVVGHGASEVAGR